MLTVTRNADRLDQDLRLAISTGQLSAGARLSSVRQLAKQYELSSSRAQRVLKRLEEDGLVVSKCGNGTFVAERPAVLAAPVGQGAPVRQLSLLLQQDYADAESLPLGAVDPAMTDFIRGLESEVGSAGVAFDLHSCSAEGGISLTGAPVIVGFETFAVPVLAALEKEAHRGCTVILVGEFDEAPDWALSISVDSAAGVRTAVTQLTRLGHRRLLFVGWQPGGIYGSADWSSARAATFEAICEDQGVAGSVERIACAAVDGRQQITAESQKLLRARLGQRDGPTACICANDALAALLIDESSQFERSVPQDLSVIGYDDSLDAMRRGLTTLHRPYREIGAVVGCLARHAGATGSAVLQSHGVMQFAPQLVMRGTTGAAPGAGGRA